MKVVCVHAVESFVSPDKPLVGWTELPMGLGVISAVLQRAGHGVDTLVVNPKTPLAETVAHIVRTQRPRLFAMTSVSTLFPLIRQVAEAVKAIDPSIAVIVGGHHATLHPRDALSCAAVDAVCVGEGDHAILEYVAALESGAPPVGLTNIWTRRGSDGSIVPAARTSFIQDLDSLPFVDRALWSRWVANPSHSTVVLLGRGCPYRCTYCANHAMQKVSDGAYFRQRSAQNVIGEIRQILELYPDCEDIYLEIETIMPKFWIGFAEQLAAFNDGLKRRVRFGVNMALTNQLMKNRELLGRLCTAFDRANIRYFNVGLESGSERLRLSVLRRPDYTNESFIGFCEVARQFGIDVNAYVLMGLPGETVSEYLETVAVVRQARPARVLLSIFYPYPGTDLYDLAARDGYFDPKALSTTADRSRPVLALPGFSRTRIITEYYLFYYRAFRGIWPLHKITIHMAWTVVKSFPALHTAVNRWAQASQWLQGLSNRYRKVALTGREAG